MTTSNGRLRMYTPILKSQDVWRILHTQHKLCSHCHGTGRVPTRAADKTCFICNGRGHAPNRCRPCGLIVGVEVQAFDAGQNLGRRLGGERPTLLEGFTAFLRLAGWPQDTLPPREWGDAFIRGAQTARLVSVRELRRTQRATS